MSFSYEPLDEGSLKDLDEWFGRKNCLYEFNPGKFVISGEFAEMVPRILQAEVRKDDVWLISYPRSGSTWCQEIVWLIGNDFDFERARNTVQHLRTPMIEMDLYYWFKNNFCEEYGSDSINYVNNLPSPRFLKTHLTGYFLPKQFEEVKPKVIYIARNPKDIYCSYYTHLKMFHALRAPFEDYAKYYIAGKAPMGCPIDHQLSFWNKRFDPNVLFLWYEDIKADTKEVIKKIANFLEKPITEENLERLQDYVSLERMKSNPGVNLEKLIEQCYGNDLIERCFFGKGQIGSWKTKMSDKMSRDFDEWIERKTKNTDLKY